MIGKRKRYETMIIIIVVTYIVVLLAATVVSGIAMLGHGKRFQWTDLFYFICLFFSCGLGIFIQGLCYRNLKKVDDTFTRMIQSSKGNFEDIKIRHISDFVKLTEQMLTIVKGSKEREYEIEYDKKQAEISNLQSQINPHFLYNVLETIRSEAIRHQDMGAAAMAEALGNYFRYNISKRRDMVSLKEELDNVDTYIGIQKYRFNDRIAYEVSIQEEQEDILYAQIPKLSLQPIVENAIYHGIEKKREGGKVTVTIAATPKRLIILVQDNGVGMHQAQIDEMNHNLKGAKAAASTRFTEKHGGIALGNINQRIRMLYGDSYGITVSSVINFGTEVEMTIPLRIEKEFN